MSHWQNLVVSRPAQLQLQHGTLCCHIENEKINLPLSDIATITLEDQRITLTHALLSACSEAGIALITCDQKHTPNGTLLSFNRHSRNAQVLRKQLEWGLPFKKRLGAKL